MPHAFIGIGSNIEPAENVRKAVKLLSCKTHILAISTIYQTASLRNPDQPLFYNGVVEIETELPPEEFKNSVLHEIENRLGRVRTSDKYAPRTIDLDILIYNQLTDYIDPEIFERPFLAIPIFELAPSFVIPESEIKISDVAASMAGLEMKPLPEFTRQIRREIENEQSKV